MKETALLYNMKCHFPILKTYLEHMEKKIKRDRNQNIIEFQSKNAASNGIDVPKPDDVVCQICNSGENDDENHIVYCSLCNITVHQNCYILPNIPEGDFVCDLCRQFGERGRLLRCPFCSCRGGAMRPTQTLAASPAFDRKNESYSMFMKSHPPDVEPYWPKGYVKFLSSLGEDRKLRPDAVNPQNLGYIYKQVDQQKSKKFDEKSSTFKKHKIKKTKKSKKLKRKYKQIKSSSMVVNEAEESSELPAIEDLIYDFYKESFVFSEEQLRDEPLPKYVWSHMSCLYWLPDVYVKPIGNNFEVRNLSQINRNLFTSRCELCKMVDGACINCSHESCYVTFHVECARRAKLHLFIKSTGAHVGFCADHTPLLFRNVMCIQERREKEEIFKMIRTIRRFLKSRKVELRDRECLLQEDDDDCDYTNIHEEVKAKAHRKCDHRENRVRSELTEYLKYVDFFSRRGLMKIKFELPLNSGYLDLVQLKRNENGFEVTGFVPAKKNFLEHKLPKTSPIFASVARQLDQTINLTYSNYVKTCHILQEIKVNGLQKPLPSTESTLAERPESSSDFPAPEQDVQLHCVCRQQWKGELMIECDRCKNWFHPKCIKVGPFIEADMANYFILCLNCREEFIRDYSNCIELINPEIYEDSM